MIWSILTRIFRQIAQVGLKSEWITLRGIFRRGIHSRRQNRVKLNAHYLNTIGPYIAPIQSNDQRNHRKSIFYALFYIDKLAFADRTPKSFFAKINIIDLFRVPENIRYDRFGHIIVHTEQSLRCGQCEGRSRYMCEKCNVGLHPECFKTFHSH